MDDRVLRPAQTLVGALDELASALHEHLDPDVVGDEVLLDQESHEVVVGLGGGREADLDLLEAHRHQGLEHPELAGRVHRVDEGLVAVAKVHRAPDRGVVEHRGRPGPIRDVHRLIRAVLLEWHLLWCHVCWWHRRPSGRRAANKKPPGRKAQEVEASGCARLYVRRSPLKLEIVIARCSQRSGRASSTADRCPRGPPISRIRSRLPGSHLGCHPLPGSPRRRR